MTRLRRPYTKVLAHSPAHNVLKWHRFFEEFLFFVQLLTACMHHAAVLHFTFLLSVNLPQIRLF